MTLRRIVFGAAMLGVALFGWLAIQVYRSKSDPEHFAAWNGPHSWMLGPSATELNDAAGRRLEEGLEKLGDPTMSPSDRIDAYRLSLASADRLLTRSLRAQPAQAGTLAKVAAVRWELDPPQSRLDMDRHVELIRLASSMAPTDPDVHRDLGKLLLLTGRREQGAAYLRRAVELSPTMAQQVVELMVDFLFDPVEIFEILPRRSETLAGLRKPFLDADRGREYIDIVAPTLASPETTAAVVRSFAETCLAVDDPRRLLDTLAAVGPFEDPGPEAERALQMAWAHWTLGEATAALEEAHRARSLQPDAGRYHEQTGTIAARAGRPEDALDAYRRALTLAARSSSSSQRRGALYRKIGQVLDGQGKSDLAYDAYKRALALDPNEPHASRRVREMEEAAGVRR